MTLAGIGLAMIVLAIAGWMVFALRRAGLGAAIAGGIGVPLVALAVYAVLGSPGLPDKPLAARQQEPDVAHGQQQVDFRKMVAGLAERLTNEPGDAEGWMMLARSYRVLEEWGAAASAWSRLLELKGEGASAMEWAELADLRIASANGRVDDIALQASERSLQIDPTVAKSRHFVALALAQRGQFPDAITRWRALLADAPQGAGWVEPIRRQLAEVEALQAQREGRPAPLAAPTTTPAPPPLLAAPQAQAQVQPQAQPQRPMQPPRLADAGDIARPQRGPSAEEVQAAREMSAGDRAAFINSMVERLAERLAENPDDPAGWLRLGRAYGVLGRSDDAASALQEAETRAAAKLPSADAAAKAELQAVLDGVQALRGNR